jgi:hypothetical protein
MAEAGGERVRDGMGRSWQSWGQAEQERTGWVLSGPREEKQGNLQGTGWLVGTAARPGPKEGSLWQGNWSLSAVGHAGEAAPRPMGRRERHGAGGP